MILAVNLNASIDKAYTVENFKPGTVTRVKEVIPTAGGKGLNVARVLNSLNQTVSVTGFIGGFSGAFIEQQLKEQKMPFEFIHVNGETRSCINIIDLSSNIHTELLEPGPYISEEELDEFLEFYTSSVKQYDVITLSGSAPRGIDTDIYAKLVSIAKDANKKVILDTSGEYLAKGIQSSPTLAKPNKSEAELLLGRKLKDTGDLASAAKELVGMGPEIVAISLGAEGVMVASGLTKEAYLAVPPKIRPVNTVGCGDAMVAGFATGLSNNWPLTECIKYAVAVSAAAALSPVTGGIVLKEVDNIIGSMDFHNLYLL
ncbi:Tagatose-6-phosphate kinase [Tepidanaerobacter acetatoxydans Re1]|uniref:Tagatose-6-phosphate kinase n=1 Tax=Tepidanaerobacter acetatoxydans (strain DSM 21804 / JCM 16047 / Re1) TaxID=1209989 RepID=F4LWN1_TEPAE|nr:1-phosphofructokinase [Tepidanaerobacter acetatoxydans]AEE90933.1 1-phosphofructokinase [Tepidanaerobacter acetatoxydans Re1]CCP25513.1 Tagatose-6-phosphate kinase [Tepidanaerobacter acetatoxydans Re1]